MKEARKRLVLSRLTGFVVSGRGRGRTADTRIFSPLLYQLSYPTSFAASALKTDVCDKVSVTRIVPKRESVRETGNRLF